jgi:glycine hydroxymethyltransferase
MKDTRIRAIIKKEEKRLSETLNLVPSENYPSQEVMNAVSSVFIGEYAEGNPKKRYYEGRQNIDELELLVQERARKLFRAEYANVQAYSGSVANLAIYNALLKPGEAIMGLSLTHGGHLSHGWKATLSGKIFRSVQYEVDPKTYQLNYDAIQKMAQKERPKILVAGFSAYPRKVNFKKMAQIARSVGAYLLADISHIVGLVIAGVHPTPFPYADVVMTTTHKMLRGPRGAIILCKQKLAQDINRSIFPGLQGGPHENSIAGIGVALAEAATPAYTQYVQQVLKNSSVLATELLSFGFDLISGGTENHLLLIDVTKNNISGAEAAGALLEAGINVNRNTIPFEKRSPFDPSGIRLGTPAATTRGLRAPEMKMLAVWIAEVLSDVKNTRIQKSIRNEVRSLLQKFPIPTLKK